MLDEIPTDLVHQIASHLDPRSLSRLDRVCTATRGVLAAHWKPSVRRHMHKELTRERHTVRRTTVPKSMIDTQDTIVVRLMLGFDRDLVIMRLFPRAPGDSVEDLVVAEGTEGAGQYTVIYRGSRDPVVRYESFYGFEIREDQWRNPPSSKSERKRSRPVSLWEYMGVTEDPMWEYLRRLVR